MGGVHAGSQDSARNKTGAKVEDKAMDNLQNLVGALVSGSLCVPSLYQRSWDVTVDRVLVHMAGRSHR
jgi:hypothetical protein